MMRFDSKTGAWSDPRDRFLCSFGVTEALAAFIATDVGLGATAGAIGADALIGAGGGALLGGITGGDPGLGALGGALTGGFAGAGGAFAGDLGLTAGAGEAIGGALGGVAGAEVTGGNPLIGAGLGALPGLGNLALGDGAILATPGGATAGAPVSGGASAVSAGPLPGAAGPIDLTSGAALGPALGPVTNPNLTLADPNLTGGGFPSGTENFSLISGPGGTGGGAGAGTLGGGGFGGTGSVDQTLAAASGGNPSGLTPQTINQIPGSDAFTPQTLVDAGGGGNTIMNAIHDPTWGNIGKAGLANAGTLLSGGMALKNLTSPTTIPGLDALTKQANLLNGQGASLASYVQSGTLPPGAQAAVNQATKGAQAAIKSKYAQLGMSGSTAETQELSNALQDAQTQAFSIADKLLQSGIQESNLSADIYSRLIAINQNQDAQTGQAIANFAASLAGGGGRAAA